MLQTRFHCGVILLYTASKIEVFLKYRLASTTRSLSSFPLVSPNTLCNCSNAVQPVSGTNSVAHTPAKKHITAKKIYVPCLILVIMDGIEIPTMESDSQMTQSERAMPFGRVALEKTSAGRAHPTGE